MGTKWKYGGHARDVAQRQRFGCPEAVGAERVWGMAVAVVWTQRPPFRAWSAARPGPLC